MSIIEKANIKTLPDTQSPRVFERCYQSPSIVLVTTAKCSPELFDEIISHLDSKGMGWLKALNTFTSRELFIGRSNNVEHFLPDVVFKKSRFTNSSSDPVSLQPKSVVNEIKSNLLLNAVVQKQIKSGKLSPPDGFNSKVSNLNIRFPSLSTYCSLS